MPKRRQDPEAEHRLLAIAVARMRSEGMTQAQIAARLDKSQPEISRLVTYAEDHQFLSKSPSFLSHNVKNADLEEVDRRHFVHEELRKALRKVVPSGPHLDVRVLSSDENEFAVAAAGCVGELLRRARLIGVMWGRSIERLSCQMKGSLNSSAHGEFRDVQCIPLCGDPVHLMNQGDVRYSASHLAAELGQTINPNRPSNQPCLVGVPAYLPRNVLLQPNGGAAWRDFLEGIPGYCAIFGPGDGKEKPWVERVDTIISGAGIIVTESQMRFHRQVSADVAIRERTGDFVRERLTQEEDITESALAQMVYGDIGGWLLARPGLGAAQRRVVEGLNQGWTGIRAEHLARVAREARAGGVPGVILLAAGPAKAEMVLELVRQRLVNELLLDSTLAEELQRLLATPPRARS